MHKVAVLLLLFPITAGPAAAACPAETSGYLYPGSHRCIPLKTLEQVCGLPPGATCKAENPNPIVATLAPTPQGDPSAGACSGCGCKGGPGYRSDQRKCVAWKQLFKTCGYPLPGTCTAERADARADEFAERQMRFARLRHRAGEHPPEPPGEDAAELSASPNE